MRLRLSLETRTLGVESATALHPRHGKLPLSSGWSLQINIIVAAHIWTKTRKWPPTTAYLLRLVSFIHFVI
jgi:hypothetical protein